MLNVLRTLMMVLMVCWVLSLSAIVPGIQADPCPNVEPDVILCPDAFPICGAYSESQKCSPWYEGESSTGKFGTKTKADYKVDIEMIPVMCYISYYCKVGPGNKCVIERL